MPVRIVPVLLVHAPKPKPAGTDFHRCACTETGTRPSGSSSIHRQAHPCVVGSVSRPRSHRTHATMTTRPVTRNAQS